MANLGNVWHIPANPEPRGRAGMRDPVFPTTTATFVTIASGNQFQGGGNPGNQLQAGSSLLFRHGTDKNWAAVPLVFDTAAGNNKYYSAKLPTSTLHAGDAVHYYLRIAYDDHDTTFLHANDDGTTSITTADEEVAVGAPFAFRVETSDVRGEWGPVFPLPNVGIHAHVLPNGLVLMWGRRDSPDQSLDVDPPTPIHAGAPPAPPAECTPFLWDPATREVRTTPPPPSDDPETRTNLFCSGHAFLPDGRLLVAGGHLTDGVGLNQITTYDPMSNTWAPSSPMIHGRWYPTLTSLPDGSVLALSGHFGDSSGNSIPNITPEVWKNGSITEIANNPVDGLDLYPRVHVASNGLVFTTGALAQTWSLNISGGGLWNKTPTHRINAQREYAASVLYDVDQIIYIGGGNPPTPNAELLDLSQAQPAWRSTAPMSFPRRQHNATILADGTVLVTGGTRSGGAGPPQNFNNLDPGQPVHVAELWHPDSKSWTELAAEHVDRCYHSTAVLLPDATVLSAGGGEFFPIEQVKVENDPQDSHRDAQIFSPPYLFKGTRPVVSSAPTATTYGETFHVETADATDIEKVTWIRLSSATHSFNTDQRFSSLHFQPATGGLDVTAPNSPNACPPGHYMMFLLNRQGVPSLANIMQIAPRTSGPSGLTGATTTQVLSVSPAPRGQATPRDAFTRRDEVLRAATGTKVVVGLTGTCPYGISACWGGANEALASLEGVQFVDPIPNGKDSTATVFLVGDQLPALDVWGEQFRRIVNESYTLRGVEVSLTGRVAIRDEELFLEEGGQRPAVLLAALSEADKVQWESSTRAPQPMRSDEATAYATLASHVRAGHTLALTVTGPLKHSKTGYTLEVRAVQH